MQKILIVIDMQNDFLDGSLSTPQAKEILPSVLEKLSEYRYNPIYLTKDTHFSDYLSTPEGKLLPVPHCIKDTTGHDFPDEINAVIPSLKEAHIIEKNTFGSLALSDTIMERYGNEVSIELVGLVTDICVVTNALLLKTFIPSADITVDARCCSGVTIEKHKSALEVMQSCHINVINMENKDD